MSFVCEYLCVYIISSSFSWLTELARTSGALICKTDDDCKRVIKCPHGEITCSDGGCACIDTKGTRSAPAPAPDEDDEENFRVPTCKTNDDCKRILLECIEGKMTCYNGRCLCINVEEIRTAAAPAPDGDDEESISLE